MDQLHTDNSRQRVRQIGSHKAAQTARSVLYVMGRDQRVKDNHALLAAQQHALQLSLPLVVLFVLQSKSGHRAREHYEFMLTGLRQVADALIALNISFELVMAASGTKNAIMDALERYQPGAVYFDFSPLKKPVRLHRAVATAALCPVYETDTHNIVPVWELSSRQEVGAYTLRPKMHKTISNWLNEPMELVHHPHGSADKVWPDESELAKMLSTHTSNGTKPAGISGERAAADALERFITERLARYAYERNDATANAQSELSPYLHFGQISSLRVALRLNEILARRGMSLGLLQSPKIPHAEGKDPLQAGVDALLEEMVIRKELSDNFCFYNPQYDCLFGAPAWARASLDEHREDPREILYDYQTLANAQTADELWNASQRQLRHSGKIHGYMRMYWAKKVMEWTESPEQAIEYLIKLNDFYSIDGGDPNGYVGILWSVAGLHDRPWFDRPVYGKIRYMNQTGAAKRFNVRKYIQQ